LQVHKSDPFLWVVVLAGRSSVPGGFTICLPLGQKSFYSTVAIFIQANFIAFNKELCLSRGYLETYVLLVAFQLGMEAESTQYSPNLLILPPVPIKPNIPILTVSRVFADPINSWDNFSGALMKGTAWGYFVLTSVVFGVVAGVQFRIVSCNNNKTRGRLTTKKYSRCLLAIINEK